MNSLKDMASDLDPEPIKLRYAEKWAQGPNGTPGPQSLVDRYLRDLSSKAEEDDKELTQESDVVCTTQGEDGTTLLAAPAVPSSQDS